MKLTITFAPPYWIGVLEMERDGCLYAARHIFGAEPSSEEVYEFVLCQFETLVERMTVGVEVDDVPQQRRINPKRALREARREAAQVGVSSKAHEAMRAQYEQNKQERRSQTREEREAERAYKRAIKQEKARRKHRGR